MSETPERPVFSEGQVLAAADLNAGVDYARGQLARHERYLHTWGIAAGLRLEGRERQTEAGVKYQTVTVSAGLAVDGRGREIVVPEAVQLSENEFEQSFVVQSDKAALYPVFLVGVDQQSSQQPLSVGSCASGSASREGEGYEIRFGRPGDEGDPPPAASAVSDGPGAQGDTAWPILLGFVTWDSSIGTGKFTGVKFLSDAGTGTQYAGVQADEVVARGGKLQLRTGLKKESGKPALAVVETDEGSELQFGPLNAAGLLNPVFTVDSKGNLTALGKVSGALASGNVYVQSGVASDGLVLPLPSGVREEDVAPGKAALHVYVNLRPNGSPPPDSANRWGAFPLACEVDAARRVTCLVRWFGLAAPVAGQVVDGAGVCDYILMVAVPAASGGTT